MVLIIGKAKVDLDTKRVLYLCLVLIGVKKLLKAFGRLDLEEWYMKHANQNEEKFS